MKGIEYPLVVTMLTREQCKSIQRPLTHAVKIALGIRKVIYGNNAKTNGGDGNKPSRSIWHTRKEETFTSHKQHTQEPSYWHTNRATHQALIMETGLLGNIFEWNHKGWKHCIEQKHE